MFVIQPIDAPKHKDETDKLKFSMLYVRMLTFQRMISQPRLSATFSYDNLSSHAADFTNFCRKEIMGQ